jgi:hypothetical protein
VPYGIKGGVFYYDWMMVYGGIFPTFPDAEHGKAWLKPWDFEVVKESAGEVTVSMSLKDDFRVFRGTEEVQGLDGYRSDLLCHAESRSRRARCARGAENPHDKAIKYEYWTCTTLAPGSDPKIPKTTGGAEIIAPIRPTARPTGRPICPTATRARAWARAVSENCATSRTGRRWASRTRRPICWAGISGRDQPRQRRGDHPHRRQYGHAGLENVDVGISVVYERNRRTQRPERTAALHRIMGGRVGRVFPQRYVSRTERSVDPETYSSTVGMSNVTHANENILINLSVEASGVNLQFFSIEPATLLRVTLKRGDAVLFNDAVKADPKNGNRISATIPPAAAGNRYS